MAIGRISGPLLKSNLIRDGVDLAFETDLLYLDVNNSRIGVNTPTPEYDLDVNGTIRSTNLQVDTQIDIAEFSIFGNTIRSSNNVINFQAAAGEATIYHSRLLIDDFQLQGNVISTEVSNSPIEIRPNGTGNIQLQANTSVTGDLNVTGDINVTGSINLRGNITIGDDSSDVIVINASIQSDIIPVTDNLYDIGDPDRRWNDIYVNNFYTTAINIPTLDIGNLIFRNNEITSTANQNINILAAGTGSVRLANFRFLNNTITNIVSGAVSIFEQSGQGYFKISGSNGFVPPVGNDAQRPTAYAVVGMTRYNNISKALEIWDGVTWASPAGSSGAVSITQAEDISVASALFLG
jgi:hypothetical protein